ncbi:MAG: hypothetical protein NVSMB22_18380 [Chloroflexota bacterium]
MKNAQQVALGNSDRRDGPRLVRLLVDVAWKLHPDDGESDHHGDRLSKEINGVLSNDLTATVTATPT